MWLPILYSLMTWQANCILQSKLYLYTVTLLPIYIMQITSTYLNRSSYGLLSYILNEINYLLDNTNFQAPIAVSPWATTLNATKASPMCIQRNPYVRQVDIEGQEDCLYLNIYTPYIDNVCFI